MDDERVSFRASTAQTMASGCLPVAALAFLGISVLSAAGGLGGDPAVRIIGTVMFGFFGIFLGLGAVSAFARADGRIVEAGPEGIWLPEMGRLPWAEIAEVRLETMRSVGGAGRGTAPYRRLGVVPCDPSIRPSTATAASWRLFDLYGGLLARIAPGTRFGAPDRAPFGAGEPELSAAQLDALLATARRYVDVVDAAERRARTRAPRWAAPAGGAVGGTTGPVDAAPPGMPARETRELPTLLGGQPAEQPRPTAHAAFHPRSTNAAGLVVRVVVSVVGVLAMAAVAISQLGRDGGPFALGFVALLVGVSALAVVPVAAEAIRWHRHGSSASLEIGPAGIWLPRAGWIRWDDVADIRTTRAAGRLLGDSPAERWRLVIVPGSGPLAGQQLGVESELLDAPFDDVLDLVRLYHPVVERA